MNAVKKTLTALTVLAAALAVIFIAGRYGWKIGGFGACQGAGITSVEVSEDAVRITGFYPGSFPEGFCGCYSEARGGTLYVGFRFSAVFGFFETGDFTVTIPVKGEISEVVLKTKRTETTIWTAQAGPAFQRSTTPSGKSAFDADVEAIYLAAAAGGCITEKTEGQGS